MPDLELPVTDTIASNCSEVKLKKFPNSTDVRLQDNDDIVDTRII